MATQNKTEQELKGILVALAIEAGWHVVGYEKREMLGIEGLAYFIDPNDVEDTDDWFGNYEFDLNFDCRYALIGEQYNPPGTNWNTGREEEGCDEYLEPLISMYPVGLGDDGYHYTDCSETLTSLTFKEFITLAEEITKPVPSQFDGEITLDQLTSG